MDFTEVFPYQKGIGSLSAPHSFHVFIQHHEASEAVYT